MNAHVCRCVCMRVRTSTPPAPPQAHERLEETKLEAVRGDNVELVQDILRDIGHLAPRDSAAAELARILREPHFQVRRAGHARG